MKKLCALLLVLTFMGMNCTFYERGEGINLEPGQKPGAKLVIQKIDGLKIIGELIAVRENSLLLKEENSGADVSVGIKDLKYVKIVRKSHTGKAALIGASYGVALTTISYVSAPEEWEGYSVWSVIGITTGLAFMGAISFVFYGMIAGTDEYYEIEGSPVDEIERVMKRLRSRARVSDFQ